MAAFYLDNDVALELATLLEAHGHDVTTARREGLRSASDDEHLLRAADQGRVLVTHNRRDYVMLHGAWLRWSSAWSVTSSHAGILVIPQPRHLPSERATRDLGSFVRSGRLLSNRLYRRRPLGTRAAWELWHLGGSWTAG